MHPLTAEVATAVRSTRSLSEQVAQLERRYEGTRCVVVTCGPSLATVPPDALSRGLDGVLTFGVKQAADVVGETMDFHCFNSFNVTRWAPVATETIRCFVREPTGRVPQLNPWDLRFDTEGAGGDLSDSLAATKAFESYGLFRTLVRPFGPGIMYELVFFLAVHLRVSEIVTVGWDISNAAGKNTHFYDSAADRAHFEQGRTPAPASQRLIVPEALRAPRRRLLAAKAHRRGELYSKTRALPGEAELMAASTEPLAAWLASVGVALTVVSDSPHFEAGVARMSSEELLDRLAGHWGPTPSPS